jgi:hypothetical protein
MFKFHINQVLLQALNMEIIPESTSAEPNRITGVFLAVSFILFSLFLFQFQFKPKIFTQNISGFDTATAIDWGTLGRAIIQKLFSFVQNFRRSFFY